MSYLALSSCTHRQLPWRRLHILNPPLTTKRVLLAQCSHIIPPTPPCSRVRKRFASCCLWLCSWIQKLKFCLFFWSEISPQHRLVQQRRHNWPIGVLFFHSPEAISSREDGKMDIQVQQSNCAVGVHGDSTSRYLSALYCHHRYFPYGLSIPPHPHSSFRTALRIVLTQLFAWPWWHKGGMKQLEGCNVCSCSSAAESAALAQDPCKVLRGQELPVQALSEPSPCHFECRVGDSCIISDGLYGN